MSDTKVFEDEQEPLLGKGPQSVRKKAKVKGSAWVDPLYAEPPTITWDKLTPLKRGYIAKAFGLCNEGLAPKRLKYGVHLLESDVEALFGVKVNSNGYAYSSLEDTSFVEKVERTWMLTHQCTSVPNTRLINVVEAKGLAYELLPNKKTNWCLHAEWTCRYQLRRFNLDREERKKSVLSAGCKKEGAMDVIDIKVEGLGAQPSRSTQVTDNGFGLEKKSGEHTMFLVEWQEALSLLNKEVPILEGLVKRCCEEKDEAKIELVKLSTQYEYGQSLLATTDLRLQTLEGECCSEDEKLTALRAEFPENEAEILASVSRVADLRCQIQAQRGVMDHMRVMFASGETRFEDAAKKTAAAEEAYGSAASKQKMWRCHWSVLIAQLRGMKAGYQRPGCFPVPLPFFYVSCKEDVGETVIVEIAPCPFCCKGFDPMWDCKFVSCQHAYHSWCAISHFSSSTSCMFNSCGKEMHEDWWVMFGIKKPDCDNAKGVHLEGWNNECDDLGTDLGDPIRTSRSFSTVGLCSARSNTVSPSVGQSFQWLGQGTMAKGEGCREVRTMQDGREDPQEHYTGEEGGSSPKYKKLIYKPLQNTVVVNTVGEGEGFQQQEKGSPLKRKRPIPSPHGGPQISPSCSEEKDVGCVPISQPLPGCNGQNVQEAGMHGEEGSGCTEKRMRGTTKKALLQTLEEDAPRQAGGDECESEADLGCDKSMSVGGEPGQEQDDNGESDEEVAPNLGRKPGKQSSKVRSKKAKRLVKERINLSTKTRAAVHKTTKTK